MKAVDFPDCTVCSSGLAPAHTACSGATMGSRAAPSTCPSSAPGRPSSSSNRRCHPRRPSKQCPRARGLQAQAQLQRRLRRVSLPTMLHTCS